MQVVEHHRAEQAPDRGHRDQAGTVSCGQPAVQADGEREMTEMASGGLISYPAGVRVSFGRAITPALLTRLHRTGPRAHHDATEAGSARSRCATCTPSAPAGSFSAMPSATSPPRLDVAYRQCHLGAR